MDLDSHPPPPIIQAIPVNPKTNNGKKVRLTVTAPSEGMLKSVEAKEAEEAQMICGDALRGAADKADSIS